MNRSRLSTASAVLGVALALAPSAAIAQPAITPPAQPGAQGAVAQRLFDDAVVLIKAGSYADACPKLEESERLDPGIGTRYLLADCYEHTGRPASAWSLFIEVAGIAGVAAARATETSRAEEYRALGGKARAKADALEPALPKLTVTVPAAVASLPGLAIDLNGVALGRVLWGSAIPVDLGEQRVTVVAKGKKTWQGAQSLEKLGESDVIDVPMLEDEAPPVKPRPKETPPRAVTTTTSQPHAGQRLTAAILLSAGAAAVIGGGVAGGIAFAKNGEAKALCPKGCREGSEDLAAGMSLIDDARTAGTISTALMIGGGAALAGGAVLWFMATPSGTPSTNGRGLQWIPVIAPSAAGGLVRGTF
jgi:hypothetical protein